MGSRSVVFDDGTRLLEGEALSVHGEYMRALEALIAGLRALSVPQQSLWLDRFSAARVEHHPDLSAAARSARSALDALERAHGDADAPEGRDWGPRIADAQAHLAAHVQIILGEPP